MHEEAEEEESDLEQIIAEIKGSDGASPEPIFVLPEEEEAAVPTTEDAGDLAFEETWIEEPAEESESRETPQDIAETSAETVPGSAAAAKKKDGKGRKTALWIVGGVVALVLLALLAAALFVNSKLNKLHFHRSGGDIEISDIEIDDEDRVDIDTEGYEERDYLSVLPEGDVYADKDVVNILLIGSDRRIPNTLDKGRADATMLLSLNKATGAVKLISFERGISVPIDDNRWDLLTHSFNYGGAELTTQIIRDCFLLDVAGYAHVDFDTFADAIDAIGGVDVELTATEAAALNGKWVTNAWTKHEMVEGINHLDGYDALQFARERYMDSDWERVRRQRDIIQAVIDKTKGATVLELNNMLDAVLPHIDTDLTKSEITSLMLHATKFAGAKAEQMTIPDRDKLWVYTGDWGHQYGCDFEYCAKQIREFIYGVETDAA